MKKNYIRRGLAAIAATGLLLVSAGCADNAEGGSESASGVADGGAGADAQPPVAPEGVTEFEQAEPGSGAGLTIGFIQLLLSVGFPQDVQAGVEAQAEIAGAELVTCDSEADAAKARDCAAQFKVQGIDGQITFQPDAAAAPSVCEAGPDVPVIAVDIVQDPCQTSFMGAANEYAGELAGYNVGKYFFEEFDCEYDAFVSLESEAVGEVNELRMGGYRKGFESVCGEIHDLRQVDTEPGGQADAAQTRMTDTLTALPGADKIIVVGINEDVILGALAAARTQDRSEDLYLGVQNLNPDNCDIYEAPHWLGSVAYFPERYGELLVPYLIKAIKGEEIPDQLLVPHEWVNADNVTENYPEYSCG